MTIRTTLFRFVVFALIATLVNLGFQRAILQFGNNGALFAAAVATGTIAGLIVKYLLDKRWVFYDPETGLKNHGRKFSIYSCMGILSTAIFWGTETGVWLVWRTEAMRELGAIIGLIIGYTVKYNLDRRFVFTDGRLAVSK